MTTNLILKSGTVYLRFSNGRKFDIMSSTKIVVDKNNWNSRTQKIKSIVKNSDVLNRKLALLKIQVLDDFNEAFVSGDVIDSHWLKSVVATFFDRPIGEKNLHNERHRIYYVEFAYWWLSKESPTYLTTGGKLMTLQEVKKYTAFVGIVESFDKNLRLRDLDYKTVMDFMNFLLTENYSRNTIQRSMGRLKYFIKKAEEYGIAINQSYKRQIHVPKTKIIEDVYLTSEEIEKIINVKLSSELNDVRDNFLISLHSGLRISDLMSLDLSNFIEDEIKIVTKKTGSAVVIPINRVIRDMLVRRNGQLPPKTSNAKFNRDVKVICKKAGINEMVEGSVYDSDKKRKVVGLYPKHKLITSHSARRTFSTLLYGKISNKDLMQICGWKNESILLHYVKSTNNDSANKLKEYWAEN